MFFILPYYWTTIFYVAVAVLPAIWLMRYIYKMDTYEKEPAYLLWQLVGMGVLAAIASVIPERIGTMVLDASPLTVNTEKYIMVFAFLVVAVVEEGMKFLFLHRRTWRDWNFNFTFDGIVYSAFVSLGFAAFENIQYVFSYGLSVVISRALLAIPGHLGFSVVMGYFYGRARQRENQGDHSGAVVSMAVGYLLAVLLHGFYDACALMQTTGSMILFLIFVLVMYVVIYRLIKRESRNNQLLV